MTTSTKRVTFSENTETHIVPAIDDEDLSNCFYNKADIRRFQIFDQYRREKQLVNGITKMMKRSNSGCKVQIDEFANMSIPAIHATLQGLAF